VDFFKAIEISAAGLGAEKARVEAAAANLANMNSSSAPGVVGYRPVTAVIHSIPVHFSQVFDGVAHLQSLPIARAEIVAQPGAGVRTAYDPGHPHTDASGMVAYPAIDHTQEMMTVVTALRSYEANLAALQVTKTLAARALDIGAQ
jgi:flagellar basal-body rod protein FlgC